MICAPLPAAPFTSRISCGTAFTVAAVPTGINTGVSTTPCGSVIRPRRPPPSLVRSIANPKPIPQFYGQLPEPSDHNPVVDFPQPDALDPALQTRLPVRGL